MFGIMVIVWVVYIVVKLYDTQSPPRVPAKPTKPVYTSESCPKGEFFYADGVKYFNDWTRGVIEVGKK